MTTRRNLLIEKLARSSFDFDLWVPSGGQYIVVDISRVRLKEKYIMDEKGKKFGRDVAFSRQLAA